MSAAGSGRWGDLRVRMISAALMASVGAVEIWLGGPTFLVLVLVVTGTMIWELAKLSAPEAPRMALALGASGALVVGLAETFPSASMTALLGLPMLMFVVTPRNDRLIAAAYALALTVAGHGLFVLRDGMGSAAVVWVVSIVVVSDVAGYFAGRTLGGPKFWPRISPKKTWSGTIAGWIGAAAMGALFWAWGYGGVGLILLSPLIAFAGQMGDIAESWIKRRAGVKDASNLIPGHGGVMDRFDALTGAMVAVMLLRLVMPLPVGG